LETVMPRMGKGQKALNRAHEHRETIELLLATTPRWQFSDWFLDWAESQLRRDRFYLYSDKEHAALANQQARMRPVTEFAGYSILELIDLALTYRADCGEDDDELLTILERQRPSELPLRLTLWLVGICRHVTGEHIPYVDDLEAATSEAEPLELVA
jgi:hypothetical protein